MYPHSTSGEATGGLEGLNPPLSSKATHEICTEPMKNISGTREYPPPKKLRTTFAGSDVSLSGGDDTPASLRSRKVLRRLQECVTDHFLAKMPVTDLYDKTQNKLLTDRMPKTLKSAGLCLLNTSLLMCTAIWQSF